MDWNPKRRLEKCPSRPQKGLVNRGSVLEGSLHPPRENVDELLELLSALSGDLPSSLTSPVIDEGSRNACRSGSILRQRNLTSQVELTSPKSSHAMTAWEGNSNRVAHSAARSTFPRTVRFADLERQTDTSSCPGNLVCRGMLHAQMDSEKCNSGGYWQVKREYSTPASTDQLQSSKSAGESQRIHVRNTEFDAPPPELLGKQPAYFNRDWTDSHQMDYTGDLCEDESESLSDLHGLLESSWTSASLHRSMLDLEMHEQLLMFELGPFSPKAAGECSPLDTLESATEKSSDMAASYNANTFRSQQRDTSCHTGRIDSRTGTPVINQENQVTNPLQPSDIMINSRLSTPPVRLHPAQMLGSSWVPVALSQNGSESNSKHLTGGTEDSFSEWRTTSDQYSDKHCSTHKALSQHGFGCKEASTEGRFSKDCATLSCRSLIPEESHFNKEETCSYSHSTGPVNAGPSLAVYHVTGSSEVPHFLLGEEIPATKGKLIENTHEVTKGKVKHSHCLLRPQDCGDSHPSFLEKRLKRQNARTCTPHILSGTFHIDKRGVAQPSSTEPAFKESAFSDSDGNPRDKRKEVVAGGKGLTARHQFWRLPDAVEVWSSSSVVTEEKRFPELRSVRLLSQCLQTWRHRHGRQAAARCLHRRRALEKGLSALRWAVTMRRMQADAMATRRRAALLSRCFGHWKACFAQKQSSALRSRLDSDANVAALRRRLIHPSESLVLRMAYCAWRRHFQGLELLRAAHMHYHLNLLFKHWLEWRRRKVVRDARAQLEQQAHLQHDTWLKSQALTTWSSAWGKVCHAQTYRRACCLSAVWRTWAEHVRRTQGRLLLKRRSEGLHRRALLQPCLSRWRVRTEQQRRARDRQNRIARMAVLHWKRAIRRKRLAQLCCNAEQLLARRAVSAAFGKWCQVKSSAATERRQVLQGRHLLARRRLQAAFTSWRRGCGVRQAAWALLERVQNAQLSRCLRCWRAVVYQRSVWLRWLCKHRALSLRRCLQHWRHALELRRLSVAFITRVFLRRRQRAQGSRREMRWGAELCGQSEWGAELCGVSEPVASPQWRAHSSLDLLLHQAFHTWMDSAHNLQLARVYHVTRQLEQVRSALQHWHRLAQQALDAQVQSFRTQLTWLDSAPSLGCESTSTVCLFLGASAGSEQALAVTERCSGQGKPCHREPHAVSHTQSGDCSACSSWQTEQKRPLLASPLLGAHAAGAQYADRPLHHAAFRLCDQSGSALKASGRLKSVALGALARIRQGPVAVAFWQWRALVRMRRGQRAIVHSLREVRDRWVLSWVFRAWRTGMLKHTAAHRHRERGLLACCFTQWSRAVRLQRGEAILRRKAEHFHTGALLVRCFSTWRRRGRVALAFWEPKDAARLERRVAWLQRRAEKETLRGGFALWSARARQNLAVRQYRRRALLARVFVAWETWAWLDQERRVLVLQRMRCRLCRATLDRWRGLAQQQREIRRRRANRLALQAKEILQRWHSYVQNRSGLCQLLCEHGERKRRRMKRVALLSWAVGAENLRRADIAAQRSLQIRFLQQWRSTALCGGRARRAVQALQEERAHRALCSAFSLWRERWRDTEQRLLGRVRRAACLWRQRALESRAEAHRAARLTSRALLRWRHARALRGERRRRVLGVAREWLRRARRRRSLREEALAFQERSRRSSLAECFRRWVTALLSSLASSAFHNRQHSRRALLAWRSLTVMTQTCRNLAVSFQAHRQGRLTASCLSRWRAALLRAQSRLLVLRHCLSQKNQQAALSAVQRWSTATRGRVMQRNRNRSRLQELFGCWKEKMEVRKAADALCVERGRRGAQSVLAVWRRWAKESRARRQMGEAVLLWVQGRTASSTFYLWVRATHQNKEASHLNCTHLRKRCLYQWQLAVKTSRQVLRAVEERVQALQLRAFFITWRKRTLSQHALHTNIQQANARQERRLLSVSRRAWHHHVEARKWRSLLLSKRYLSFWMQAMLLKRRGNQRELEDSVESGLSQEYLRRWRRRVLERRFARRRAHLLWASWRSQTAAAVLFRGMSAHRLQEWAWLTWRKRWIRTRVSLTFATHRSRVLLAQAFFVWRDRTL